MTDNAENTVADNTPTPGVSTKAQRPSSRGRWLLLGAVIAVAGGGTYLAWGGGDAVETTNNEIRFETSPTSNTLKPIVKGGITDLLNDHPIAAAENPLDPLLLVAEAGLERLRQDLKDYTATIERQERVDGKLMPTETIALKIRQAQHNEEGETTVSRAIYTRHMAPKSMAGQEAIWEQGENDGNLVAHIPPGFLNVKRFYLPPTGFLAMRGSRTPSPKPGSKS